MDGGVDFYVQAIISVLVITDPITRGILFKAMTAGEPERRPEYVCRSPSRWRSRSAPAVAGKQILDALGIDLGAFGIAGVPVVALMGSFEGSVIVPCATPFVAGPGAITLVITIASSTSGWEGPIAALVAVAIAVALLPISHLYLANKINLSEQAMKVFTKFGGQVLRAVVGRLLAALSSRVKQRGRCSARRWNGASSTP